MILFLSLQAKQTLKARPSAPCLVIFVDKSTTLLKAKQKLNPRPSALWLVIVDETTLAFMLNIWELV